MAIQDDFTIYPATKVIRHTSGTTVYAVQALYSWLMDVFDEPGYMTYSTPMKYNTPTSYTMLNGWFLDNGDGSTLLKYLTGGSIDTSGYTADVLVLNLDSLTGSLCVPGDKDKIVTDDAADVGPLLAYVSLTTDTGVWWIRDTTTHGAILDNSVMAITTGTGAGDAFGGSASGEDIYCNIYTIASFPGTPDPQVYIFQGTSRISEWSGLTNWDRGSLDVLIEIKRAGVEISSGDVTVYVRQTGDSFTYAEADLTSGSRTPVAVETAPDISNTTGEHYLLYDNESSVPTVGIVLDDGPGAGVPPTFYAEVVAVTDWGASGLLTLRGLRGTIADNTDLYSGGVLKVKSNGTPGDTYGTWSAEAAGPVAGDVGKTLLGGTSTAKRILCGYQDDGATGKFVAKVDTTAVGTSRAVQYKAYSLGEALTAVTGTMNVTSGAISTTVISGWDDVTVAHINGTCTIGAVTGTYTIGEKVTWDAGASSGIIVKYTSAATMTLGNVTSPDTITGDTITGEYSGATCVAGSNLTDSNTATFAFTQQPAYDYSVFVEGGSIYNAGRDLDQIYQYLRYILRDGSTYSVYTSTGSAITIMEGQAYIKAVAAYTATKASPYGTLAGGVFFGAQGVWLQGMDALDANNIRLTDHSAAQRQPYASIVVKVTNTVAGDSVAVYKKSATKTEPDKAMYTSHNTNNAQGDSTFERLVVEGSFPIDTPSSGTFIVVDASASEEHRYRYDSWSTGILTMPTKRTGTADGLTATQELYDAGATFSTWGIQRGDILRRTSGAGGWCYVVTVVSETHITTTQISGSTPAWSVADTYEMLALVVTYTSSDLFFIPYIDETAVGTDVQVTVLYNADVDTLIVARDTDSVPKIQPFVTTSQITSAGMTSAVIRNTDEVAL
jgi:hypothetical protein